MRGTRDATVPAGKNGRKSAARELQAFDDVGDHPDVRILRLVARHEKHLLLVSHVYRERDGHAGEYDGVVERNESECSHGG